MNNIICNFDSLDLVPIGSLLQSDKSSWIRFFVPAYQRGYRWSAEQVEQLIEDLEEFEIRKKKNKDAFYCIQPLVIKPIVYDNIEYLEVIDGQQRLTTILLILQALRQLQYEKERDNDAKSYFERLPKEAYEIKYETRIPSSEWLPKLSKTLLSKEAYEEIANQNCDYCHFAEVFKAAYNKLKSLSDIGSFKNILKRDTYFIWYLPSADDTNNVEIFDRLNAGKIGLNNAELVKALFLQHSNIPSVPDSDKQSALSNLATLQKIAHEWDDMERQLHNNALWGFIYSKIHQELEYDSRIEYFLDLQQNKTGKEKERYYYTFNAYLNSYRNILRETNAEPGGCKNIAPRLEWVKKEWDKIKYLFDLVKEWFNDRHVYHRIGFIIEYTNYTLKQLESLLPPLSHSERISKLDEIIKETVSGISSKHLFYGKKELSEILFLYNILLEDKRHNSSARFSFADYKQVRKDKGWDQEHIASNQDYEPNAGEQIELANDLIELITGNLPVKSEVNNSDDSSPKDDAKNKANNLCTYELAKGTDFLDEEEQQLCNQLLEILNQHDNSRLSQERLESIYDAISKHFNGQEDSLKEFKNGKREKDFIWNFVLLNSKTNRSYGNHIFPVKRRRILSDEFEVYTPVGTRNVFEKAYSRKVEHFLAWTRSDAKAYWENIKKVLEDYITLTDIE